MTFEGPVDFRRAFSVTLTDGSVFRIKDYARNREVQSLFCLW